MNAVATDSQPLVGIIMGSQSDWATLEHTANMLKQLGVPFEAEVVSAHRTPDRLFEYAETARDRGIQVIIAGAGGAAHLPGIGDGLSDDVPASTPDGGDVALSDGEFVVPSDVVSHLGNGSTEAGSRRLQDMMDRVRAARTGSPASPEPIDPRMMVPA